jgi:peptidoglycan hydrolase-like protein with peptidoglycan-binding domain
MMKQTFSHGLLALALLIIPVCALAQTSLEPETSAQWRITSKEVAAVQIELRERDYYQAKINGILDQATREALRRYQTEHGLTASGRIDRATLDHLEIAYPATGKEKDRYRRQDRISHTGYAVKDNAVSTGKTVSGAAHTVVKYGKAGVEKTAEVATKVVGKIKR